MECMKSTFVPGQLLDNRFRTVAPLNHGSFGMVFLAVDILTGSEVAIKCSTKPPGPDASPSSPTEDEELYCHKVLRHDHLVNLVHYFETDAHTNLVLEYCSQGDLYEAIRVGRGPLETEHVRDFMLQLLSAVEHMHSKGLYHRDIKPENIFLTQAGSLKLGDFGLATRAPWSYESCVGSDRYMAPEQYDPGSTGYSSSQVDTWSIGICLLNILFSRNPFTTPTESDVLFADFRRDRQSLFDVFPNMSQDTFEILSHALAIDPEKRSLAAVRDALMRTISFTTDDERLDDFCTEDRELVQASANREPLRTPSLQSPVLTQTGSFPWAKALHSKSPQTGRQLSAIADTEIYDEDLFPDSHRDPASSWFTGQQNTPSMASVLDSGLGASYESMTMNRPGKSFQLPCDPLPITGSLPAPSSAKLIPSMSMIFGKRNNEVSKSWSDLWDEEAEEAEEFEQAKLAVKQRREQNARSFSHAIEEEEDDATVSTDKHAVGRSNALREQSHSTSNIPRRADFQPDVRMEPSSIEDENGFVLIEHSRPSEGSPLKRDAADKWVELGNKRRSGLHNPMFSPAAPKKRAMTTRWRKELGLGESVNDYGMSPLRGSRATYHARPAWLDQDWRREPHARCQHKMSCDGADDDLEWVGGWHAFHL